MVRFNKTYCNLLLRTEHNISLLNYSFNVTFLNSHWDYKTEVVIINSYTTNKILNTIIKNLMGLSIGRLIKITVGDGENYKSLNCFRSLLKILQHERIRKSSLIISLGGGVLGDLTGFVSSCYMRGTQLFHLPTTLLAQTDSSIGGKNGLNSCAGKNTVGSFYFARNIIIDVANLISLPQREWLCGLCEIIKLAVGSDCAFFNWIEKQIQEILMRRTKSVISLVKRAGEIKSYVVSRDLNEKGVRAMLNLGHTFGHAIELHLNFTRWTHGEAISCGLIMAAKASLGLDLIGKDITGRLIRLLSVCKLPIRLPFGMKMNKMIEMMLSDKKNTLGRINLVLLKAIGDSIIISCSAAELELLFNSI